MSNHHSHRQRVSDGKDRLPRQPVSGSFPAARARGLTEALSEALVELEQERLQTTRRLNPDDDDEDPTRRG